MIVAYPSPLRLASSPEYRLCGRSLRTAMPSAFFCPIRTSNRLPRVSPCMAGCTTEEAISAVSCEKLHPFRVVLKIYKTIAVIQLHLKQPKHCKPQKAGNLRPGVAA